MALATVPGIAAAGGSVAFARSLLAVVLLVGCTSQGTVSPDPASLTASARTQTSAPASATPAPTARASALPTAQPVTPAPSTPPAWTATTPMLSEHAFHTATQLPDGRVLVAGGLINDRLDGQPSRAAEIYDPDRGTWTATGTMIDARWRHTATLLADGTVLVMGGNAGRLDSAEVYDPATGRWSPTGRLTARRAGHTATLLPDGTVLVVGGGDEDTTMEGGPRSRTAERYDPKTGQWSATGRLIEARTGFTATLLRDGLVLVAGGDGGFMAAERYDPAAATWAVTGPMTEGRHGHTATLLADGTVLVAGGCACSEPGAIATAELYRPDAGSWTPTGAMGTPRIFHTATLLSDGTVLVVADGVDMGGRPSAERYDPGRGRWSPTASPIHARFGDTATLLADGRVLVAGGYEPDTQSFAEVYDPGSGS